MEYPLLSFVRCIIIDCMDISYGYILCGKYNIILEILNILFDKNNILIGEFMK